MSPRNADFDSCDQPQVRMTSTINHCNDNYKRRVSFAPYGMQRYGLHISEYTQEEVFNSWYTSNEIKAIQFDVRLIIRKVKFGTPLAANESSHGLEGYTHDGSRMKQLTRENARNAVLYEQEEQRLEHFKDDDELAIVYMEHTYDTTIAAYERGLANEREVAVKTSSTILHNTHNNSMTHQLLDQQQHDVHHKQPKQHHTSATKKLQRTLNTMIYRFRNNNKVQCTNPAA